MSTAPDAAFFVDSSYIDDHTDPKELEYLLSAPKRTHLVQPVVRELRPHFRRHLGHPLYRALQRDDAALVRHIRLPAQAPGRIAFEYYVSLLLERRVLAGTVRQQIASESGCPPETLRECDVLDRVQRTFGVRARLLTQKPLSRHSADEILVYRAVEFALRNERETVILTRDADLEEQFFKLTWLLSSHYKAMYCAASYADDFASFRTIQVPGAQGETGWWPIEPKGAVLVDASRWGPSQESVLPQESGRIGIHCINAGPSGSAMTFVADPDLLKIIEMKDRTRGRSTDRLGSRNVHVSVPDQLLPGGKPTTDWILIGRDRIASMPPFRCQVPLLDLNSALTCHEHPRPVEFVSESPWVPRRLRS
jgi:hypothetical protein